MLRNGLMVVVFSCLLSLPFLAHAVPGSISPPGEKIILVDPNSHTWGAYSASGKLLRSGIATAGGRWCPGTVSPCRRRKDRAPCRGR